MAPRAPVVAVVGPGRDASADELAAAEAAGAAIAAAGAVLVCGGLGGVMEAACRGARSEGGMTIGLLPGTDREDANGWVVLALPTGLGEGRNALIVRAADAVVAIGGGLGTLSRDRVRAAGRACRCSAWGRGSWRATARRSRACGRCGDAATAVAEALRSVR